MIEIKRNKHQPHSVGSPIRKIRYIEPKAGQSQSDAAVEARCALGHWMNTITAMKIINAQKLEAIAIVDNCTEENIAEYELALQILREQKQELEKAYPIVEFLNLTGIDSIREKDPRNPGLALYQYHPELNIQ